MSEKELWNYLWDKKVTHSRPFDRDFIWIQKGDFDAVERHFIEETNLIHPEKSMRSRALVRHIHAVAQGDYVFIHKDTGNLVRFFPLGLVHIAFDVAPYFLYARYKRLPMQKIFLRPRPRTSSSLASGKRKMV